MNTTRVSTLQVPRTPRASLRSLLAGAAIAGMLGVSWMGCTFGWDSYDPRLGGAGGAGGGGAASTGTEGSGPSTSTGGAASTSSTGGAASTSGTGGASSSSGTGGAASSSGMGGASSSSGTGGASSSSGTGGASSSSSSSGGTGGAGGGPIDCGGTSVLTDDFSGNDPGEVLATYGGGGGIASRTGGEAVVALPSNSATYSWGEFDSNRVYDLRGDSVSIEVTSAPNPTTSGAVWYGAGYKDNYVGIYEQQGVLQFEHVLAGSQTLLKTTAYDPVAHRHWRFREDGQTTYWETSSDGVSWTAMAQVPSATLFPMNLVWIWFGGGMNSGEASPGEIRFDRLNGGGPPKEKWCPVSSFKDDFNDGLQSRAWSRSWEDSPGMLAETGGELVVTLVPNAKGSASYVSAIAFDLTNSSLLVEVTSAVSSADGSKTRIALVGPGAGVEISKFQGQLHFSFRVLNGWQDLGTLLYSPVEHRWWRVRESSNTLYWETSPDGKAWMSQAQLSPVPFPIEALDLYVGSDGWAAQPSPGVSSFDNLNLPPP